ncbi:hypothetical protein [Agrobacterium tumefaciens]|uniref:Uncharacterized protein n=1 Tax=Agrobacterium tumefaciens TaxID=358 RepID=A0A546XYQ6_AGRTU|nr:hypothetical protein [Agrobacterium tumefaciens]NSX90111.1 hypothetical protein [Agrobacterium tumefaciens]TRB05826.1 hypothetical protein EXN61_11360 [Agrobacterium tumefaciens]
MDEAKVATEMHEMMDEKLDAGVIALPSHIVAKMLDKRQAILGDDAEFYRVHTFDRLMQIAKRVVGKFRADDETASQLLLPGFQHLCKAYPMMRDGEVAIVPVTLCTDEELLARANQLDEMAKGCRAHAREIRQYISARGREAA